MEGLVHHRSVLVAVCRVRTGCVWGAVVNHGSTVATGCKGPLGAWWVRPVSPQILVGSGYFYTAAAAELTTALVLCGDESDPCNRVFGIK